MICTVLSAIARPWTGAPGQTAGLAQKPALQKPKRALSRCDLTGLLQMLAHPTPRMETDLGFTTPRYSRAVWSFLGQRRHQRKGWELVTLATKQEGRGKQRRRRGRREGKSTAESRQLPVQFAELYLEIFSH